MPTRSDIEHLLRRTEFVARRARVDELSAAQTLSAAVDNLLSVPANPGTVSFSKPEEWQKGEELTYYWFDRMAHDSPRPLQEKMAMFWHGHFCTDLNKVGWAANLREQIDLFRHSGLGHLRQLAKSVSTQPAMLRYLDNEHNKLTSPNENFGRELMELFLLGVGNYVEADVRAATAAWTGHTITEDRTQAVARYTWRADWHDASTKTFLGRTINGGGDGAQHGHETIDVILGNGVVPAGAPAAANRGRPTRQVAAEFISRKLWSFFAGTPAPDDVVASLRDVALANDFAIKPWLKALLTHPAFYSEGVKCGLVRSPVDYFVAAMVACRVGAVGMPIWMLLPMGQRPLYPPDVSGWKHNAYFVSPSAMSQRAAAAGSFGWLSMQGYWEGDGRIRLAGGDLTKPEIEGSLRDQPDVVVDRVLDLMQVEVGPVTRGALYAHSRACEPWERVDLVSLVLMTPEFHLA